MTSVQQVNQLTNDCSRGILSNHAWVAMIPAFDPHTRLPPSPPPPPPGAPPPPPLSPSLCPYIQAQPREPVSCKWVAEMGPGSPNPTSWRGRCSHRSAATLNLPAIAFTNGGS